MRSVRFSADEKYCLRLVPQVSQKEVNSIEIYKDCNFETPHALIAARFATKSLQAQKKGVPPTMVDGRFDGLDLCPLNPLNPEKSPFYVFAW